MIKCAHCLLDFPAGDAVRGTVDGQEKVFCCNGCRGVYRLIHEEGLAGFYEKRRWDNPGISSTTPGEEIDIAPFAEHVRTIDGLNEIDIYIEGIRCASCVWLNEKMLARTEGVCYARVNYATHRARLRWDPGLAGLEKILRRIQSIGYIPKPWSESEQLRTRRAETSDLLVRFGTAGFFSSQLMIYSAALYAGYFQGIDAHTKLVFEVIAMLLTLPVIFYSGQPFLRNAITGLRNLHFNMDSLITVGAGSAFVYSIYAMFTGGEVYFDTAAMIITLILLGRFIEAAAKGKASEALEGLAGLSPKEARIVSESGETRKVSIGSVKKGDLLEVVPGERVPLDGIVRSGVSEVDEALITGESKPVSKSEGSEVIGGSMNLYGAFVLEVTRTGRETILSGIIRAVEDAQANRPRIQTLADKVVGYFVPVILLFAASAILFYLLRGAPAQRALMTGISVLVIACPCSLGLATPIAVLIFTSMASAKGILIKDGEVAENAGKTDRLVFDKTGTITLGRPVLRETIVLDQASDKEYVVALAAAVEKMSEHSIGHAIAAAAMKGTAAPAFPVTGFNAIPGKGVSGVVEGRKIVIGNLEMMAENGISSENVRSIPEIASPFEKDGDTVVYMGWEGSLRAMMVISDVVRDEACVVVSELRAMGCDVSIVSGDNAVTAGAIARKTGIGHTVSGVSPVGKKKVIDRMQEKGERVMMVGDGINDAPALTRAAVGVAMGRGTDIAMESADAVLLRNDLFLIPYCIRLSKKTYAIIKQNIFWSFFYNIISIPLAFTGVLHPIIAAGAMAASSLFVVGNSLRIKRLSDRDPAAVRGSSTHGGFGSARSAIPESTPTQGLSLFPRPQPDSRE